MARLLAIVSLYLLFLSNTVFASPCVAFDANFNLLAFGLGGKDWFAGTQDTWTSSQWDCSSILAVVDPFFPFTFRHSCFRHNRFWTPVSPTRLHPNNPSSHHIGADHSTDPTPLVTYHRPVFIESAFFTFMIVASPQFYNAIYVMGGDTANPSSVYIYDASTKSWSTQSVTTGSFDPTSFDAILDHDTNVFCMHLLSFL